jgi:short-subunit dehydrogenase
MKTILIAGATGNIGKAAAIALAEEGARVVVLGRSLLKLQDCERQIREAVSKTTHGSHTPDI